MALRMNKIHSYAEYLKTRKRVKIEPRYGKLQKYNKRQVNSRMLITERIYYPHRQISGCQ